MNLKLFNLLKATFTGQLPDAPEELINKMAEKVVAKAEGEDVITLSGRKILVQEDGEWRLVEHEKGGGHA